MISNQTIPFAPGKENHLVSKSDTDTPKGEGDQKNDVFKMLFQSFQNQESDEDSSQNTSDKNPDVVTEAKKDSSEKSESTILSDGEGNETVLKAGEESQDSILSERDSETEASETGASETGEGGNETDDQANLQILGGRFTLGDDGKSMEGELNAGSEQSGESSGLGEAGGETAENSEVLVANDENQKTGGEGEKIDSNTDQTNVEVEETASNTEQTNIDTEDGDQTNTDGEKTIKAGNEDAEKTELTEKDGKQNISAEPKEVKQEGSEDSKKDQQLKTPASEKTESDSSDKQQSSQNNNTASVAGADRATEGENIKIDSESGKEEKQGRINEVKIESNEKVANSILQGNSENNQTDKQQNVDRQVKEDTVRQNIPKRIQQLFAAGTQASNTQTESRPEMPAPTGTAAPDESDKSTAGKQKEQVENLFRTVQSGNVAKSEVEILNLKASQVRELNFQKYRTNISNRTELAGDTKTPLPGNTSSSNNSIDNQTLLKINGSLPADTSTLTDQASDEGDILWKEHTIEYFESKEKSNTDSQIQGLSRLSQIPISNVSLRRNFVPGISQSILQATGGGKGTSETWQKHNFSLENGKNIQVSSRQIDGVLQLKLGSSHSELNKLLSQHLNEIREHLEKECDLEIKLELDSGGNQDLAEFFGESSSNNPNGDQRKQTGGQQEKTTSATVEEVLPKSVRKFGYNQMEWTA